jgi:glycosyltransferase involved in cell wall biosynthesis
MRLIGLVESDDHVCCRYRLRAFQNLLTRAGHSLEVRAVRRRWRDRIDIFAALGGADAVILQRRLLSPWRFRFLRHRARRLIFDFDDAVFMRDSYSAKGADSPRRRRRFAAIVRAADAVVAGNEWLAEQARRSGAAGLVRVIPSCVEPAGYPRARHDGGRAARLVWVGSSSTLRGLELVRDLFDTVGANVPGARLKLVSDRSPDFGRLPVEAVCWSEATEAAEIAAADIGISWVPDDDWSRGKCGLKILQYMAAGLPVVANPVGVHPTIVRHGETGFLARTPDEWIEAIRRLAGDPDLRRRMGTAARWIVEGEYSVTAGGRRWLDLLRTLAAPRRAAG